MLTWSLPLLLHAVAAMVDELNPQVATLLREIPLRTDERDLFWL